MRLYILLLFILFSGKLMFAQNLQGHIYDAKTKQAIEGVNVISEDQLHGCYSNSNGKFLLKNTKSEKLLISHVGYLDKVYVTGVDKNDIIIYLDPSSTLLSDIEIGITKNQLPGFSQSASISTLSKTQIQDNVSRSMAEAMNITPGVWMQKTNHGGGSPFVRGLTGNYVLLLIDGIRLNNSTFRYGPNQYFNTISPFSVNSVEVLRSGGSTLYGSDAIGGTININTKNPSFEKDKKLYGGVSGQMMSHDMEYTGRLNLGSSHKDFAFLISGGLRKFGDIYAGEGIGYQVPSGYSEKDINFKGLWQFKENSKLTFNYQWLRQDDVPRYDKVAQKGYEYYNFSLQQRQLAYLRYDKKWQNSPLTGFQITASFQESNEERDTKKNDTFWTKNERDDVLTFGLTSQLDAVLFKKIDVVSGLDFYYDWINSSRELENVESGEKEVFSRGLYPDGSSSFTSAFYNTYLHKVNKWIFELGWRFNYSVNKAEDEIFDELDQSSASLVWNASINYRLKKGHIYTSVNTSFRAPNINDISSLGDFDYGVEVPASDLRPETSKNIEIGYKMAGKALNFNIAYYYTRIQDLIDRIPLSYNGDSIFNGSKVYKKANVGEAYITGLELDFQTKLSPGFSLQGSATYAYGTNISKDEPFRRIPPLFGDLSLRYDHKNYFIALQTLAANEQDRLSGGDIDDHRIPDGGTPGWFVANIKSGLDWKKISVHLALNNLFNEAYRYHGSGVDGLGRHVAASLSYHF